MGGVVHVERSSRLLGGHVGSRGLDSLLESFWFQTRERASGGGVY